MLNRTEQTLSVPEPRTQPVSQPTYPLVTATRWCFYVLALLLTTFRVGLTADAPSGLANLAGLADATLGVSQLTADGAQCGLQLERIGDSAHRIIADAGIALRADSLNRVTISAITARVGPTECATAVLLGAYAKVSFFNAPVGWVQDGYVVLWQRSVMVASPIGQHAAAVIDATQLLGHQMLTDWRGQNPPPARVIGQSDAQPSGDHRVAAQAAPTPSKATQ